MHDELIRTEFEGAFCQKFELLVDRFSSFFPKRRKSVEKMIHQKKSRGHRTSKIVKSRQSSGNGHLPYHLFILWVSALAHGWRGMRICVRSKDAQKQLARTSLSTLLEPLAKQTGLDNREFRLWNISSFFIRCRPRLRRRGCLSSLIFMHNAWIVSSSGDDTPFRPYHWQNNPFHSRLRFVLTNNVCVLKHRGPTQSVCVADSYFIVNVLELPFASPIAIYC